MTSPFVVSPVGYGDIPQGGQLMPMVIAARNPSNTIDKQYAAGYLWLSSLDMYQIVGGVRSYGSGNLYYQAGNTSGTPNWVLVSDLTGPVESVAGTANQITATTTAGAVTLSTPSTFIAPGSIASTTTLTGGTGITATTGNLTLSGVGSGFVTTPTVVAAGASPQVANGRIGQVTFSGVSIASGTSQTFVITNSSITGSGTVIQYAWFGATAGSALSIASVTNSAGSSSIVMTNGTSATMVTSVANITFVYEVLN